MKGKSSTTIPQGSTSENQGEKVAVFKFYVLVDPRDNKIKYVGRTVDQDNRLRNHIYEAKKNNLNKRERWIVALLRRNLKPILKVIYSITCSLDEAIQTEKTLVKKLTKKGFELKNEPDNYLGAVLTGKVVYQYDLEGNYLKQFPNAHQAEIITKIKDCNIGRACKTKKSAGNFLWSFEKLEKLPKFDSDWRKKKGKTIISIDQNGVEREFITSRIASKELSLNYKKISSVLNGRQKSTQGYIFKFKN